MVAQIRTRAQARGDEADWTRALVREAQIRGGLHAYETAVRLLREAPWPPSASNKAILELFYGQTLVNYLHVYSWEIRQRERVESKDPLDLKKWTTDEIAAEASTPRRSGQDAGCRTRTAWKPGDYRSAAGPSDPHVP